MSKVAGSATIYLDSEVGKPLTANEPLFPVSSFEVGHFCLFSESGVAFSANTTFKPSTVGEHRETRVKPTSPKLHLHFCLNPDPGLKLQL